MKNDYLWDKTGSDHEIEKLERVLKVFRYQPTVAPKLPAKILQLKAQSTFRLSHRKLQFALAGIAVAAVGFISLGYWFRASNDKPVVVEDMSQKSILPTEAISSIAPRGAREIDFQPVDKRANQARSVSKQNTNKFVFSQKPSNVRVIKEVKLTGEEQFAFDQLMLALSITGSKLKEVKNKANGIDETTATFKTIR